MAEGEEIEPKAPVEVSISYADPIAVEEGAEAEVIHFAESGIEMLQTETDSEIQQGEQISTFEYTQDSFSVTGTLLKYTGSVASGKYLIIVASGKAPDTKYYALNANGGATQITRNSDNVTFADVPDDCQWEIEKVNDNGQYTLKNGNSNITLWFNSVVGSWPQKINIIPNSNRSAVVLNNPGGTYLGWSNNNFAMVNGSGQPVYLARINTDISRKGQAEVPLGETDLGDLSAWKERITSSKFDADKTAQVYNYDQRIYEVDIKASSNMLAILPSIDLELIVDTSRSMFFPATLNPVSNTTFNDKQQLVDLTNSGNLDQNQIYYFIGGGEAATVYALYYGKSNNNLNDDADTPKWRYVDASYMNPPDGENQKFTDWLNKMEGKNIEDFGVGGTSETLNVPGQLYTSPDGISRFAYLKEAIRIAGEIVYAIDSNARIGLVTFNKEAEAKGFFGDINSLNNGLGQITLAGGTQQDKGLSTGQQMFDSSGRSNSQKIAVLITDGAPNQTNWTNITTAAEKLKNSGVTLYTLGLSLDMVGGNNKTNLANIVTGGDSVQRAYAAENGSEIAAAVKALIESLVRQADVVSTVTDTIDLAYYPVTQDGTPLKDGDYIDLQGNLLSGKPVSGNDYGTISYDSASDSYSVTWEHQRIHYEDQNSSSSGWDGKFYVKAKENFLGGNTIKTNSNTNADKIQAETMIVTDPKTGAVTTTDISDKNISIEFETPIVNVKELELTGHDATWTLYVGAEVTDDQLKQQVSNLFNNIEVHEIVKEDGTPVINDDDIPVSFKLKELVGGDLTDAELNKLIAGESVTRTYSHYGHENIGSITINLVRETKENGDTEYKISATYVSNDPLVKDPDTGEVINWHNGPSGPGRWMNPIHSNNTQTVDDYYLPNSFKIEKVNGSGNAIADSPALFKLYRKTKDGDPGTPVPLDRYDPNNTDPYLHNNQFTSIETAHTINGIANIGGLLDEFGKTKDESLLLNAADGPYYLIESGAPMGYSRTRTPVKIEVIPGPNIYTYSNANGEEVTQVGGTPPESIFNMKQGVTIKINGQEVAVVDSNGNVVKDEEGNPKTYLLEGDTGYYQTTIVNNPLTAETSVDQGQILPHKKTIDYLGDGQDNPDTTVDNDVSVSEENANAINDLYRLYLDAKLFNTVTNANVILVEDYTTSMNTETMDTKSRYETVRGVLKGDADHVGFINTVLAEDAGNQLSVIKFSNPQGSGVLVNWTGDAQTAITAIDQDYPTVSASDSTNYEKALSLVQQQIDAIPAARQSYPTYVIFMSDGLPTAYINNLGNEVTAYDNMINIPEGLTREAIDGKENIENLNWVLGTSIDAVTSFQNGKTNIQICTIGLGDKMSTVMTAENIGHSTPATDAPFYYAGKTYDFILKDLASTDPADSTKLYRNVTTEEQLRNALNYFVKTPNVTKVLVSDELSEYVRLYANQLDFAVTKTTLSGVKTSLSVAYDSDAHNYKVTDNGSEVGRIVINGNTISLDFKDDLAYSTGTTYALSFNVEATTKAYEEYAANVNNAGNNGYGTVTGDKGTDYENIVSDGTATYSNDTSSEKPGFYSNTTATVNYTYKDDERTAQYDKPVIQVGETKLEVVKEWEPAAPKGVDQISVKVFKDGSAYSTVTLKKSDDWKTTVEHLVPKKLVSTDQDSSAYDKDGVALKKTEYAPVVYTLEELASEDEAVTEILKKYAVTYEFTATESADRKSFTNITSRYDSSSKKLVYYIPAQSATASQAAMEDSESGKAVIKNKKLTDIEILKVDEKEDPFDGAVFQLQKKEKEGGSYENIKAIREGNSLKYPNVGGLDSESKFTSGTVAVTITNLPDGAYQLVELSTKPGYVITHKEIQFTIESGVINGTDIEKTVKFEKATGNKLAIITVTNNPGVALPQTGGIGTGIFTAIGAALSGTAGAILTLKKRREREN